MMRPNLVASQASQTNFPPSLHTDVGVVVGSASCSLIDRNLSRALASSPMISRYASLCWTSSSPSRRSFRHPSPSYPISQSRRIVSRSSRFGSTPPSTSPTSFPITSFVLSRLRNLSQDPDPSLPCNIASPQRLPGLWLTSWYPDSLPPVHQLGFYY